VSGRRLRNILIVGVLAAFLVTSVPAFGGAKGWGGEVGIQAAYYPEDMYEPDGTFEDAYQYDPVADGNTFSSYRTFHGTTNEVEDGYDMVAITVEETGTPIWVETMYLGDISYDTYVHIYNEDETMVASADDNDYWGGTYSESLYYVAPEPGLYYVQVENGDMPCFYELHITVGNARRVWGDNRFATAAEVSRLQWDNTGNPYYGTGYGPEHIVIANGFNPADALAGGSLAAQLGGVLLLTDRDYLPQETYDEIMRVSESRFWYADDVRVHVLGGEAAVSDDVYMELTQMRNVTHIYRHDGPDRYATAAAIADALADEVMIGTTAYIVNGNAWADALAVAPVAARDSAPVLMTFTNEVPQVTLDWLEGNGIANVVIVGGESVVSAAVFDELDALYGVERVFGANRYETAKEIALYGVDNLGMEGALATLASGENFADALSAAPIAWWTGAPVLLTPKNSLHVAVAEYFDESGQIGRAYDEGIWDEGIWDEGIGAYVLGGPAAISEAVYDAFRDHWLVLLP